MQSGSIQRAQPVEAGQKAAPSEVQVEKSVGGATGAPVYVDLESPAIRARVEALKTKSEEPVATRTPVQAPSRTRRIDFDVPEVRVVNPTDQWVFIPNPEKMRAPSQEKD